MCQATDDRLTAQAEDIPYMSKRVPNCKRPKYELIRCEVFCSSVRRKSGYLQRWQDRLSLTQSIIDLRYPPDGPPADQRDPQPPRPAPLLQRLSHVSSACRSMYPSLRPRCAVALVQPPYPEEEDEQNLRAADGRGWPPEDLVEHDVTTCVIAADSSVRVCVIEYGLYVPS